MFVSVTIPELFAQTQGSDYGQLIHSFTGKQSAYVLCFLRAPPPPPPITEMIKVAPAS